MWRDATQAQIHLTTSHGRCSWQLCTATFMHFDISCTRLPLPSEACCSGLQAHHLYISLVFIEVQRPLSLDRATSVAFSGPY